MIGFSRRQLARYAVDELLNGQRPSVLAKRLSAAMMISGLRKQVDLLLADIDQELEDRGLLAKAKVTSAHPLSDDLRAELAATLRTAAKVQDVLIEDRVDQELLGGLKIETANHAWDMTARKMLNDIKDKT